MSGAMLEFTQKILSSDDLRTRLREAGERGLFFETAPAAAAEMSLDISAADLRETERRNQREWAERFL